jgi:hypothetical protein
MIYSRLVSISSRLMNPNEILTLSSQIQKPERRREFLVNIRNLGRCKF